MNERMRNERLESDTHEEQLDKGRAGKSQKAGANREKKERENRHMDELRACHTDALFIKHEERTPLSRVMDARAGSCHVLLLRMYVHVLELSLHAHAPCPCLNSPCMYMLELTVHVHVHVSLCRYTAACIMRADACLQQHHTHMNRSTRCMLSLSWDGQMFNVWMEQAQSMLTHGD